jgi:hypothetical protein
MQNDPNLRQFERVENGPRDSTHRLLGSHGAQRSVNMNTPRTITITDRGGTSQGVFIILSGMNIPTAADLSLEYRITFTGQVLTGSGTHQLELVAVRGSSREGTVQSTLTTVNTRADGSFTLNHTISQLGINALVSRNVERLRFGGASGQDLLITGITITEIRRG